MSEIRELEPGLRLLRAANPSVMTDTGTNTYLLGDRNFAVIDPGPALPEHLDAILDATDGRVSHIFVTHAHMDHSPLSRSLSKATGAPVFAFGDAFSGRDPLIASIAGIGGGEGVDDTFRPDSTLADGETIAGDGWSLTALWTPGHFGNHMSFVWRDVVFTGDLVMGWSTSFVSPPDGDMSRYLASCRRLGEQKWRGFYPGHGEPIDEPNARIEWLLSHRMLREGQILNALGRGPATPSELSRNIYTDLDPRLLAAAERNVLAHLMDLLARNLVEVIGTPTAASRFTRVGNFC